MAFDNTNSGAIFKKDEHTPPQPGYGGNISTKCEHCGKDSDFWLSAWVKTAGPNARNPGAKFFSLAATPKDDQPQGTYADRNAADAGFDEDDDIPF